MNAPVLTVIVALQDARQSIVACVESLLAQVGLRPGTLEIIVVDGLRDDTAALVAARYPQVTLLRADVPGSLPYLLGAGIEQARGQLMAVSEDICTFAPGWAVAAIAAHARHTSPAIGGSVEPEEGLGALNHALFLCDYGQFLLPLTRGAAHDLPGNNIVFTRDVFERGRDWKQTGFWKTRFCQQLEAEGHLLRAEPRMLVRYRRRLSLQALVRRRFQHGRCFGATRARDLGNIHRLVYALAGPLVPGLLFAKYLHRVWPKTRARRSFIHTLPQAWLVLALWALGEWVGTVFGAGASCEQL